MRQSQRFTNKNHYDENAALTYTENNPSIANSTRIFSMKIAIDDGVLKETSNFNGEEGDFPKLRNRRIDSSLSCPELQKQIQRNLECIRLKTVGHFQYFELINCEVKEEKPTKIRLKTVASIPKDEPERAASKFLEEERAICVIRGQKNPIQRNMFPKRIRGSSCYLCGNRSGDYLLKCGANGCSVRFHKNCAVQSFVGGYTFSFMNRSGKFFCSMHHCTACFADHNRSRCFSGQFVSCDQCELAWHLECIPGGCEVDNKNTITCPRHVLFQDSLVCHVRHCADCQKEPEPDEKLINCTKCFRAMHHSCYIQTKLGPPENEEQNLEVATCHWCDMFDFVRVGEFAMARFSRQKWYPCQVVSNSEFILPKDPFLGSVGYVCVKWLPYKNKIFYNLVSHNRVIGMSVDDFFYATEAKKSDIYEEWTEAQQLTLLNGPRYRELKPYQIPSVSESNGEKMIRKVNRNKYSRPELKTPRDRLFQADLCKCASRSSDRCGPTSDCINRMLRLECPKECGEAPNAGCNNRSISEGNNCIPVSIEYFSGKGYGAIALQDVPQGGFVGEYVGEIVDKEEKKRRIERIASRQSNEAQYYIMELDENRAIDAQFYGNDMRYVNHSCNPNCVIQQIQSDNDIHLVLIANRRIKKGEELSFDYNMQGSGREVPICHCKEANCTKKLSANCVYKRKRYDWEEKAMSTTVVCNSNAGAAKDDKRCPSFPIVKRPLGRPKKAVEEKPTAEETVPKPMKRSRHH